MTTCMVGNAYKEWILLGFRLQRDQSSYTCTCYVQYVTGVSFLNEAEGE